MKNFSLKMGIFELFNNQGCCTLNASKLGTYITNRFCIMKSISIFSFVLAAFSAQAQISVDLSGSSVKVKTGGGKGTSTSIATNTEGTIDSDVEMEGIAVINGQVFIDGVKIPRGKTSYVSKKSGKSYTIKSGKDNNVSVQENSGDAK